MHELQRTTATAAPESTTQAAPGKRTLVQRLGAGLARAATSRSTPASAPGPTAPIQRRDGGPSAGVVDDPFSLHLEGGAAQAVAARGVDGPGGALPHQAAIQAAFGRHDVSGVSAHVGGAAADAASQLGAEAYATGDRIGFAGAPSLHTAAHEAAHVVQQRAGVSLKGGVGEAGDPYERHADQVADAVVAGRSVEALLDHGPGGGGGSAAIQKQEPGAAPAAAAPASAPAADPAAAPPSKGDALRLAVLAAAEKRLAEKTTIVSAAKIDDMRTGNVDLKIASLPDGSTLTMKLPLNKPMKNFTTCIEFAGQTFGDATKQVGKDGKDAAGLAKLLPGILGILNKETELHATIEAFQKGLMMFDKPIGDLEQRADPIRADVEALKARAPTGDKAADKAAATELKQKEQVLHQLDAALAMVEKQRDKIQAKIDKLQGDLAVVEGKDDALIRAEPGTTARPKPGEYVLLGAAGAQAYGVSKETKVSLVKGAFKHIAVFQSAEAVTPTKGDLTEKWERWHTIDGGGIEPVARTFNVRLKDMLVFYNDPGTPWEVSQTVLIGWIDMNKLVDSGQPAAPAAGAAPAP